jgi:hypothetical protein
MRRVLGVVVILVGILVFLPTAVVGWCLLRDIDNSPYSHWRFLEFLRERWVDVFIGHMPVWMCLVIVVGGGLITMTATMLGLHIIRFAGDERTERTSHGRAHR